MSHSRRPKQRTSPRWLSSSLRTSTSLLLLTCPTILAGCNGSLGSGGAGDEATTSPSDDSAEGVDDNDPSGKELDDVAPASCDTDEHFVATTTVRRITRRQYNRTVELLLGDTTKPADLFPVETREEGYDNQTSSQHVQQPEVIAWERAATDLAASAAEDLQHSLGCSDELNVDDCFRSSLHDTLRRFLRSRPSEALVERYLSLYEVFLEESAPRRSAELVLRAILLAPQFLFLVEEGLEWENGQARLSGHEIAARLSFTLWNEAPGGALLDAAEAGELETAAGVARWAEEMLKDARADAVVLDFHSQWIDLAQLDNMVLPDWADSALRTSAREEIEWFISDWYAGSGLVPDLFRSRSSYVDAGLAELYGLDAPEGDSAREVQLPEDERAGLLTRAVFLGTHGIPPTRGDFVLARVLCSPVPPLAFMPPLPPDLGETATTREKFEKHAEDPCAASCHGVLDPVGFAFEHYDNAGQWRDTENGQPVDSATVLTLPEDSGLSGPIAGANDLSELIAESSLTTGCLGENWFRYAYGRAARPVDDCSVASLQEALAENDDVRDLLLRLTQTDAFLYIRKEGL